LSTKVDGADAAGGCLLRWASGLHNSDGWILMKRPRKLPSDCSFAASWWRAGCRQ